MMGTASTGVLAASFALLVSISAMAQGGEASPAPQPMVSLQPGLFIQVLTPPPAQTGSPPLQIVLPEGPAMAPAAPAGAASAAPALPPPSAAPALPPPERQATVAPQQTVVIQVNSPPQLSWQVVPTVGYPQPNVFSLMPVTVVP